MPSVQSRSLIAVRVFPAGRNTDAAACPIVRHTAAVTQNFAWVRSEEILTLILWWFRGNRKLL